MNNSFSVDGQIISKIERGLCVFVGLCRDDSTADVDWM